jgi:carboxyl-terminal processing protease
VVRLRRTTLRKKILALIALLAMCAAGAAVLGTPRAQSAYRSLADFARVLTHVERLYVDEVDGEDLVVGAIHGMLRTLDPHSSYMTAEDFRILEGDTRGRFGGVGLEVGARDGDLTVIAPIPGTPAERAGLRPGDRIVAIEGRPTRELSIDEAVRRMRGEAGTEVRITVGRKGVPEPFGVTLMREVIRVESIAAELLEPGFPWIRVKTFQDGTAADARLAVERLGREGGGLRGVLLDLRRNPGGLLDEAVRLSDLFLDSGVIVTTRGRGGVEIARHEARSRGTLPRMPVVVLVDAASASAAEIVAGALQDSGRALVVGTATFGKGSVQSLIPLGDGAGLKLTVARYYTPAGRSIQAEGIRPDVEVESLAAPEPDEETRLLESVAEKDLPGALAVERGAATEQAGDPPIDDYQLRIAFQILRGQARAASRGSGKAP